MKNNFGGTERPNFQKLNRRLRRVKTKSAQRPEQDWPDPQPLHGELRPVEKLLPEMIPEPLRAWIEDVADRMPCPIDFVAAPTVCALSISIGAGCSIRPKQHDDWAVPPNLWGMIVAPSGRKKSPAIKSAFLLIKRLEEMAFEEFEEKKRKHAIEMDAYEAQRKGDPHRNRKGSEER